MTSIPRLDGAACVNAVPAKDLCRRCVARPECLVYALENVVDGVCGGYTRHERARMRSTFGIKLRGESS